MTEISSPINGKFGLVGIFGRANAGKSTLVNALVGEMVSIVSSRPQTTRKKILGIVTRNESQVVFCDTPGLHQIKNKLDAYMICEIESVPKVVCGAVYLFDSTDLRLEEDRGYIEKLFSGVNTPKIALLTKIDSPKSKVNSSLIEEISKLGKFDSILEISSKSGKGLEQVWKEIVCWLPEGPHAYSSEDYTTQTEREICEEVIREEILSCFYQEVPHSVAVTIDEFKERENGKTYVSAVLNVEKEGHKKIVIGTKGENLKKLGMAARLRLNSQLGRDFYLSLWVKVRPNWRKNEDWIRKLGYKPQVL
ncbi:MAG: GTPase Era [Candidatus Riflebacteria bacterium]|nr:GTPase Era [Candidatus Riflebacteria bacterium]